MGVLSGPAGTGENAARRALEQLQLEKLQTLLEPVLQSNSFYKEKLERAGLARAAEVSSLEDYQRLPFTTKEELSADQVGHPPYGTNLTFARERYIRIHQTTGTTGERLRWLDTEESWQWWGRCWRAVYEGAGVTAADLTTIIPEALHEPLRQALRNFSSKIRGFDSQEAVAIGLETTTSAPLQILRDPQHLQSPTVNGLYPCGEGAGFAGGIVSSAIDGIRVADAIAEVLA